MLFNIVCTLAFYPLLLAGSVLAQEPTTTVPTRTDSPCPTETPATPLSGYVCSDYRLGPTSLPTASPIANMLVGYKQFGGVSPQAYFHHWFNSSASRPAYINPPGNGFELDAYGRPMFANVTFRVGDLLDRFGARNGSFLSRRGTPYAQRAVSPRNISPTSGFVYYLFNVTRAFDAQQGRSAPWFGQPGGEFQYYLQHNYTENLREDGYLDLLESH
ncbi:hypothetical protein BJX99DRAFT_261355 [Aspergillus californicus]